MKEIKTKVNQELNSRIKDQKELISSGTLETLDEYKRQSGYLSGLSDALMIFNESFDQFLRAEGYDDIHNFH